MAYKIYLSPEDRTSNTYHSSALYNGHTTNEHEQMCRLADLLANALVRCGFEVQNDQETGSGAVYRRVDRSNQWPADLHVALHTNGFDGKVQGTRVHCYPSEKSRKIGKLIQDRIAPLSPGTVGERVVESNGLIELKKPIATAVLPEFEFHDNAESAKWLIANMPIIAEETCHAICDFFGIKYVEGNNREKIEPVKPTNQTGKTVNITLPQLSFGDVGDSVEAVQHLLNGNGFSCGEADGVWGAMTDSAVLLYQIANGLTADKICGKQTWNKLLNG